MRSATAAMPPALRHRGALCVSSPLCLFFFPLFFFPPKTVFSSPLAVHHRRFSLIKKVIILEERGAACLFFSVFADRGKRGRGSRGRKNGFCGRETEDGEEKRL